MNRATIGVIVLAAQVSVFVPEAVCGEPLEQWHGRDCPAQGAALWSVAYGNGLFTAVGDNGTVITSPDGVTWTQQACPSTNNLGWVVYGNGVFLAGGALDTLLVSTNGADWLSTPCPGLPPPDEWPEGIAFAGGYFFLLTSTNFRIWVFSDFYLSGRYPIVCASATATNWTSSLAFPETAGPVRDVAYGEGQYLAVGARPDMGDWWSPDMPYGPVSLLTSPDAVVWNDPLLDQWPRSLLFPYFPLRRVAYGNGRFVAVGEGSCVFFPESTNYVQTFGGPFWCVRFGGGFFIGTDWDRALVTSSDGINWTARDAGQGDLSILDVAYGRNTFVAVGGAGLILQSDPIVGLSLRPAAAGNGQGSGMELTISGPPGGTCQVQCAGQIPPPNGWQTVASVTLSDAPTIWVDPDAAGASPRFYRAVLPP